MENFLWKTFFFRHILFTRWTNYKFSTFIANTNIWIAHCLGPGVFLHLSLQFTVPKCVAKLECLASSIRNCVNTQTQDLFIPFFFHRHHVSFFFGLNGKIFAYVQWTYIFMLSVDEAEFRLISWCAHPGKIHQTKSKYVCIMHWTLYNDVNIFCVPIFWALFFYGLQKTRNMWNKFENLTKKKYVENGKQENPIRYNGYLTSPNPVSIFFRVFVSLHFLLLLFLFSCTHSNWWSSVWHEFAY